MLHSFLTKLMENFWKKNHDFHITIADRRFFHYPLNVIGYIPENPIN